MPILLAFLAIPLLEIVLFVQLGGALGVLGTLLEIFASGALGVFLLRLEPYRNATDIRAALAQERSPASPMANSALRMIAAILLVIPGFLTDAIGLLLLIPAVRFLALRRVVAKAGPAPRDDIIDGDYTTHAPDTDHDTLPPSPDQNRD
ncbi:MAG: FxsA family protein [Alphaproteobacteria bacterium]|jgi:UPF0716 protein FxsA|nr:FxsA family protein [Alphaproteobacteria bacterium]